MTRKHFETIARALFLASPDADNEPVARLSWCSLCSTLAIVFGQINSRFNRVRFFTTCGFTPQEVERWHDVLN